MCVTGVKKMSLNQQCQSTERHSKQQLRPEKITQ